MDRLLEMMLGALVPLVSLGHCGDARATVGFAETHGSPVTRDLVRIEWSGGGEPHVIDRRTSAARGVEGGGWMGMNDVETLTRGRLKASATVTAPDGRVVGRASVDLPLAEDRAWIISFSAEGENPALLCEGCAGVRAFPIDPAYRQTSRDSLYVVWSRNSIRHPVVF